MIYVQETEGNEGKRYNALSGDCLIGRGTLVVDGVEKKIQAEIDTTVPDRFSPEGGWMYTIHLLGRHRGRMLTEEHCDTLEQVKSEIAYLEKVGIEMYDDGTWNNCERAERWRREYEKESAERRALAAERDKLPMRYIVCI